MKDEEKKSDAGGKAPKEKQEPETEFQCCYLVDPCGYFIDPCGCYVNPCRCC